MKNALALAVAPFLLVLLFAVCGLFAAIFSGVLWLLAAHWIIALVSGVALWIVVAFVLRILLEKV